MSATVTAGVVEERLRAVTAQWFERQREADEWREREDEAAKSIQRVWRGYRSRRLLAALHRYARSVQAQYRGYRARKAVAVLRQRRAADRKLAYYNEAAVQIQRHWKGFSTRRNREDFYRRKRYVAEVTRQAEELRARVAAEAAHMTRVEGDVRRAEQAERVKKATRNTHHLLSTASRKGIYASARGSEYDARAMGRTVEDHLRTTERERYAGETTKRRAK